MGIKILKDRGVFLNERKLHWSTFPAGLSSMSPDCLLSDLRSICLLKNALTQFVMRKANSWSKEVRVSNRNDEEYISKAGEGFNLGEEAQG